MYKFINENAEAILEEAEKTYKDGLRGYVECYLKTLKWKELNSTNKEKYIRNYKKFYAMNAARIKKEDSENFYNEYFGILCLGEKTPLNKLIDKLQDKTNSIQFSFATKLLHTLDHHQPIFDKYIEAFFLFPDRQGKKSVCLDIYDSLKEEYQRIKDCGLLFNAINAFKIEILKKNLSQEITDEKIIDFYIWQFSKMMKDPNQMKSNGFRKKIRYEM